MSKRPSIDPLFGTNPSTGQLVEPPAIYVRNGFNTAQRAPAQWFNYLFSGIGSWIARLRGPSSANWQRTSYSAGITLAQIAVDRTQDLDGRPLRRVVAVDTGLTNRVHTSVRGNSWASLTMLPGGSIGSARCVTAALQHWVVGGTIPSGDGGVFYTAFDPDPASAVLSAANSWFISTLPGGTTAIGAVAFHATTTVAVSTNNILYVIGIPIAFNSATLGAAVSGTFTDVIWSGTQWIAITSTGQIWKASVATGMWSVATTIGARDWRLASDSNGIIIAYPLNEASAIGWYKSSDYGASWAAHTPPGWITLIKRIRVIDGAWLLTSAFGPFMAEANDPAEALWSQLPVPYIEGASSHVVWDVGQIQGGLVAIGVEHWLLSQRGEDLAPGPWGAVNSGYPRADAAYLRGFPIAATAPTTGYALLFDGATWAPSALPASGVPTSRLITAGTGLTGGGDLTVDRTLTVAFGATGTTVCVGNDARLSDSRTPIVTAAYTWTQAQAFSTTISVGLATAPVSGAAIAFNQGLWWRNSAGNAFILGVRLTTANILELGDSNNAQVIITTASTAVVDIQVASVAGFRYRGYMNAGAGIQQQLKLSEPIEQSGTAGWTLLDLSPTLTTQGTGAKRAISYSVSVVERFGINETGCLIGLRLARTAVNDAAHTAALLSTWVDLTGITAARVVTGPASAIEGTVITISNSDGSASGTKKITFTPAAGTVNGAASHDGITTAYGSCTYAFNGTNWTIAAKV